MPTSSTKRSHNKENTWNIPQITQEFGVSRTVLNRFKREGMFPSPVEWNPFLGPKTHPRYDRDQVREALKNYKPYRQEVEAKVNLKLTHEELRKIRTAAKLLYITPDRYMVDVLNNHARKVLKAEERGTF